MGRIRGPPGLAILLVLTLLSACVGGSASTRSTASPGTTPSVAVTPNRVCSSLSELRRSIGDFADLSQDASPTAILLTFKGMQEAWTYLEEQPTTSPDLDSAMTELESSVEILMQEGSGSWRFANVKAAATVSAIAAEEAFRSSCGVD